MILERSETNELSLRITQFPEWKESLVYNTVQDKSQWFMATSLI